MLQKLRSRLHSEEKGFTLIELLVVILIIGILAAIALPAFLGQRERGQDASAKSNARNMVSELESCFATEETYAPATCGATDPSIPTTTVTAGDADSYTIVATSENPGQSFSIVKTTGTGVVTRTCAIASDGGCTANSDW